MAKVAGQDLLVDYRSCSSCWEAHRGVWILSLTQAYMEPRPQPQQAMYDQTLWHRLHGKGLHAKTKPTAVFLHGLQVGCLFVFGLASCTVKMKASIEQLLRCLLISLLEAKSVSQQPQTRALKSLNSHVLWPLVPKWLAASQPITGNSLQHDVHVCHMETCMWLMSKRGHKGCWDVFWKITSVLESQTVLFTSALHLQAWSSALAALSSQPCFFAERNG